MIYIQNVMTTTCNIRLFYFKRSNKRLHKVMLKHAFLSNTDNKCFNACYTYGQVAEQQVMKGNNNLVFTHSNVLNNKPLPEEGSMPKHRNTVFLNEVLIPKYATPLRSSKRYKIDLGWPMQSKEPLNHGLRDWLSALDKVYVLPAPKVSEMLEWWPKYIAVLSAGANPQSVLMPSSWASQHWYRLLMAAKQISTWSPSWR